MQWFVEKGWEGVGFAEADLRIVANDGPSNTTPFGLSRGLNTGHQTPGVGEGYQLSSTVGYYGWRGYGERGRGRGV